MYYLVLRGKFNHKQNCCPESGIVYPVCSMPIYTQSRGIVFITYLCR